MGGSGALTLLAHLLFLIAKKYVAVTCACRLRGVLLHLAFLQSRARCLADYASFAWYQADPLRFKSRRDGKQYPIRVTKAADPSQ